MAAVGTVGHLQDPSEAPTPVAQSRTGWSLPPHQWGSAASRVRSERSAPSVGRPGVLLMEVPLGGSSPVVPRSARVAIRPGVLVPRRWGPVVDWIHQSWIKYVPISCWVTP